MFKKDVYINRRNSLQKKMKSGIALILGNTEASYNYPDNTYRWRQDSNFVYFFGLQLPNLAGVIDIDANEHILFGDDLTLDDIIWMGPQPSMKQNANKIGVKKVMKYTDLKEYLTDNIRKGRKIHFLPAYRGEHYIELERLTGISHKAVNDYVSPELVSAIISIREIKEAVEIEEIERSVNITREMHIAGMKMAKPGVYEYQIAGTVEGIARSHNGYISFPVICSINGQTLHNHLHNNKLKKGRMLVLDAGAESDMLYAGDITRTTPVGGKFDSRQKDIYTAVLEANLKGIEGVKPGVINVDNHIAAVEVLLQHLKDLKLVKGNVHDAVINGAGGFFMPHGLGHQMGLDVHDMEGFGENLVGYDSKTKRSTTPGIGSLRMGKKLKAGHVFTVEPGCYFIPELYDRWSAEGKCKDYINYDKVKEYLDFGGIRIEDDILVTKTGYKVLGKHIPKTIEEVEETCREA